MICNQRPRFPSRTHIIKITEKNDCGKEQAANAVSAKNMLHVLRNRKARNDLTMRVWKILAYMQLNRFFVSPVPGMLGHIGPYFSEDEKFIAEQYNFRIACFQMIYLYIKTRVFFVVNRALKCAT